MRIKAVRVENFQCVRDSGPIPLDHNLTVLVGANEAGKSATLRALWHMNTDKSFMPADVSTFSSIVQRLERGEIKKSEVDMVTVWVSLEESDKSLLGSATSSLPDSLRIVKRLDDSYAVLTEEGTPIFREVVKEGTTRLENYLEELRKKVSGVYTGEVKRAGDRFVILQRHSGEAEGDNLILNFQGAGELWGLLTTGQKVQVTKVAEPIFGPMRRAMNVGEYFDLAGCIETFLKQLRSRQGSPAECMAQFKVTISKLPRNHPLRQDYVAEDVIKHLEGLTTVAKVSSELGDIDKAIVNRLPRFVYLDSLVNVADKAYLKNISERKLDESEWQLTSLLSATGLRPEAALSKDLAERLKILDIHADTISALMSEHWPAEVHLEFGFLDKDRAVGLAVDGLGSVDPPSRRSRGFESYLALFALISRLASLKNVVLLADDPCVFLHPVAQRRVLKLLEGQMFQVVVATHLPFLIDPERLDRVRLLRRSDAGTQLEEDWAKNPESLTAVWGALGVGLMGKVPLLVEGPDDREYLEAMNRICRSLKREGLARIFVILPAFGSNLPQLADAFYSQGMDFLVLVDGDQGGDKIKQRLIAQCRIDDKRITSLREIVPTESGQEIEIEDLFSHAIVAKGIRQVIKESGKGSAHIDDETLERFERLFKAVNARLNLEL